MYDIVVANRQAYGTSNGVSRSLSARVLESLNYLVEQSKVRLTVVNENDVEFDFQRGQIVIFARHTSAHSFNLALRAKDAGCKVIYDLDDFMPALPSWVHHSTNEVVKDNITAHIRNADLVITSTDALKKHIDHHYRVVSTVVPSGINIKRHAPDSGKRFHKADHLIYTNTDTIKLNRFKYGFVDTVNSFALLHPGMKLDLICDPNPEMSKFVGANNLGAMDWFAHKRFLAENDYKFALIPLGGAEDPEDFVFNSCKSPIKYLDYGASRIPGIYSKTPAYENFVTDMETGILVENNHRAWTDAMELLTKNTHLRDQIASNAYEDVRSRFDTSVTTVKWVNILESLAT